MHAVDGGWHLAPYPDEIIAKTVEALNEDQSGLSLIPVQCAGFRTMMAIEREMPQSWHARGLRRLVAIPSLIADDGQAETYALGWRKERSRGCSGATRGVNPQDGRNT